VVVAVVVVVDLYGASRSASNALIVPLRRKKDDFFQSRSEAVGTPSRVLEWVWKRVPFHRTRNGEARRPNVLRRCRGTINWWRLADLKRWRLMTSDVRVQQSIRYWGALFCRRRWTVTPSLYWTRCGMSSQCSSEWSSWDKPRSTFRVPLTTRAAAFSTPIVWQELRSRNPQILSHALARRRVRIEREKGLLRYPG